jgi:hypothetical protein
VTRRPLRFRAVVEKDGVNPFVRIPERVRAACAPFAERGRVRVTTRVAGQEAQGTLIPDRDGSQRLYMNGGIRARAGIGVGDRVAVELRPLRADEVGVPADLTRALAKARLRGRFDALGVTLRRELVRSVEDARSEQNRTARIERTLAHLRGESAQRPRPALADKPLWICPRCGHPYASRNLNHSCERHSLEELFERRSPDVRALFEAFRALVDERGPNTMIVYRDHVGFMVKVRFCGLTPKRDHVELGFWFIDRDTHTRFSKIETLTTSAHIHRVRIWSQEELDADVKRWIDRSYRVGRREHLSG